MTDTSSDPTERSPWEGRVLPANTRKPDERDAGETKSSARDDRDDRDDDHPERSPSGPALWFWWAVATTAGWALAGACVGAFFDPSETSPWQYVFVPLTGLFQWLILRRHFARASWWLVATTAGTLVAAVIYFGLFSLPADLFGSRTVSVLGSFSDVTDGIAIATAQWFILRQTVRGAVRWFPAVLAPLLFIAWLDLQMTADPNAAAAVEDLSRVAQIMLAAGFVGVRGVLVGAFTGAILMRLVDEPR